MLKVSQLYYKVHEMPCAVLLIRMTAVLDIS